MNGPWMCNLLNLLNKKTVKFNLKTFDISQTKTLVQTLTLEKQEQN